MKMKKITAFILTAGILLSLCACGNKNTGSRIETEPQSAETEEAVSAGAETQATEIAATEKEIDIAACKAAYKEVVKEYMEEAGENGVGEMGPGFGLIYLDDDEVPELFISEGHLHIASCRLYCFDGEKAVYVGTYGSFGSFNYRPESGVFFSKNGHSMGTSSEYYMFKNGTVKSLGRFENVLKGWDENMENPEYGYYIDDNEVSFEEYTQAEEQLVKEYGLDKAIDSNSQEKYELNSEGVKDYETFEEGISN